MPELAGPARSRPGVNDPQLNRHYIELARSRSDFLNIKVGVQLAQRHHDRLGGVRPGPRARRQRTVALGSEAGHQHRGRDRVAGYAGLLPQAAALSTDERPDVIGRESRRLP